MKPRRSGFLFGLILVLSISFNANALDPLDFLSPYYGGTQPVALAGGDTPTTKKVSLTGYLTTATQLVAANTVRSRRKVCFQNQGNIIVYLGTSTVAASDFYLLGETTSTANSNSYCTNSSGAFYAYVSTGSGFGTIGVLEETQTP